MFLFLKGSCKIQRTWIVAFLHADIARRFYRGNFIVVGHVVVAVAADYNNKDAAAAALVCAEYTKQKQMMSLFSGEKKMRPNISLPIYPIYPLINRKGERKTNFQRALPPVPFHPIACKLTMIANVQMLAPRGVLVHAYALYPGNTENPPLSPVIGKG